MDGITDVSCAMKKISSWHVICSQHMHETTNFRKPMLTNHTRCSRGVSYPFLCIPGNSRRNCITRVVAIVVLILVVMGNNTSTSSNTFHDVRGVCCNMKYQLYFYIYYYHYYHCLTYWYKRFDCHYDLLQYSTNRLLSSLSPICAPVLWSNMLCEHNLQQLCIYRWKSL